MTGVQTCALPIFPFDHVNGVDMIEWDADGKITDFKVMVRPLKAMQTVHAAMGRMLAQMKEQA